MTNEKNYTEHKANEKNSKSIFLKIICILLALLMMVGISALVATIIHRRGGSVPASTTIENGLSAYELAVQYGYDGLPRKPYRPVLCRSAHGADISACR